MRTLACLAVTVATLVPTDAGAEVILRRMLQNAGTACTGALPTYEGALRKRPQAIANEGGATAFVTCSLVADELAPENPHFAYLRLVNQTATDVPATCTLIVGAHWQGSESLTMTHIVPANDRVNFQWGSTGLVVPFAKRQVNFSCALPPGIAVAYVGQEVGEVVAEETGKP